MWAFLLILWAWFVGAFASLGDILRTTIPCVLLLACAGCKSPEGVENTLKILQQGKAKGSLILSSDGRVSAAQTLDFSFGPQKSMLAFEGKIDFADDVRHVTDFGNHPHAAGDPIPLTTDPDLTAPNADDE
jgi:hypothetical protein